MFNGEGNHDLPRFEARLSERDPWAWRRRPAGLLFELPRSRRLWLLARVHLSFDHRPGTVVGSGEVRPSRMAQQHLELRFDAVGEKTRRSQDPRHYAGCVTLPATIPAPGAAAFAVDPRLQLGRSEPLGVGVKRVALDEFERAAAGFFEPEDHFHSAAHGARKSIKRVRAILAAVRGDLGEKVYRYEDRYLRDTGRMLAEVRSAVAVAEVAILIRDLYGEFLAPGAFDETIRGLERRRDILTLKTMEDPHLIGQVVHNLERAHQRYQAWPTDPDAAVYGRTISDSFAALGPGLGSTYRDGRHRMVKAYKGPSDDNFHDWRKRVKGLRHQLEFLMPLWPEVLVGMVMTLDTLGAFLGEDHDFAELAALLRVRPDLCANPRERSVLFALVTQRRAELRLASEILGRRIYADHPDAFHHRFGEYWTSRAQAVSSPLDTLVVY